MQNLQILNFGHLKMGIANRAQFMEGTAIKRDLQAAAKVNWTPLRVTRPSELKVLRQSLVGRDWRAGSRVRSPHRNCIWCHYPIDA